MRVVRISLLQIQSHRPFERRRIPVYVCPWLSKYAPCLSFPFRSSPVLRHRQSLRYSRAVEITYLALGRAEVLPNVSIINGVSGGLSLFSNHLNALHAESKEAPSFFNFIAAKNFLQLFSLCVFYVQICTKA